MISVFRKHLQPPARLTFAAFEIDLRDSVLRKNGEPVHIGRQAFRALALLVSKGGDLVTREELQKAIWGDSVHVDFEPGLNVCIRKVRAALGDAAEGNQIIVTCPREGYRLGVPVKRAADVRRHSLRKWGVAAAGLAVVAGGYLLAPSIIGGYAAPSNVSRAAPTNLAAVSVSRPWPTQNLEAYTWYWRGRGYADRTTGSKPFGALPFFEKAAELDSNFALAQVGLAVAYMDRGAEGIAPVESAIRARAAAHRALALDARSAETHVALAELSYRLDDDDLTAQREFAHAVELDERNTYVRQRYAEFLQEQRRFDDALAQLRVAQELDPLSVILSWQKADTLFLAHRFEEAVAQASRTLELDPNHSWSFRTMGQSLDAMGKHEEAIEAYLKAGQVAFGHLGRLYALTGRRSAAREILSALTRRPVEGNGQNGVAIAYIYTGLGEPEKAIEWLEKAHRDGVRLPFSLRVAPQWAPLRTTRAFDEFLKRNRVAGI